MSFLAPLYILGLSAIAAPIIFHLIRRAPRGEVAFSSLMFLSPTPPRLTRRSRLDQILLLLLRATAICLLALAFARPFLRQAARRDFAQEERRRIALLIDTSASMRRADLWPRAQALAKELIASCRPADDLAVFAFDSSSRPLLGFAESMTLEPGRRRTIASALVDHLKPTWGSTNLGQALVDAVAAIEDVADARSSSGRMPRRVVLVSDLPQGSKLDALGDFEWPKDVELDLKPVSEKGSNAGLERLVESIATAPGEAAGRRVRVVNSASSHRDRFELSWIDDKGKSAGAPVDVYVPAGESRVVRMPVPAGLAGRVLRLTGDNYDFDNSLYFAQDPPEELTVLFVGSDRADDPAGLLYYLDRAFLDSPVRRVHVEGVPGTSMLAMPAKRPIALVVLAAETSAENAGLLRQYAKDGGTLLYVAPHPTRSETLAALTESPALALQDATVARDVMLGEITFDHPLFSALAGPQFNDFTKIHFWRYRRVTPGSLGEARVLARFENGDPAVIEKLMDKGRIIVLSSGWQPADSQLARSSKFVPLLGALLELANRRPSATGNIAVGTPAPLPVEPGAATECLVHKPDGTTVRTSLASGSFGATDQPGIYQVDTSDGARSFAVNLDSGETNTAPLQIETLEQLGCRLVNLTALTVDAEQLRQMRNLELENRQKLWRWLILAAIGVLVVETWLAGRSAKRVRPARVEVLST